MHAYAVSLSIPIEMAACHLREQFHGYSYRLCTERTLSVSLCVDFSAGGRGVCSCGAPGFHIKAPDAAAADNHIKDGPHPNNDDDDLY